MLQIRNYVKAASLDEAYELNQKKSNVIIGGMHWLKMSRKNVDTAIDLSGLGLNFIRETDDSFEIGAMTSLRQLETHEMLNKYSCFAVRDAVKDIVGVQFRNTATIGGSIFGRYGFSDVLTVFMAMDSYAKLYKGGIVPLREYAIRKADRDIIESIIVNKKPLKISYMAQRHARTDFPILTCAVSNLEGRWCAVLGARPLKAVFIEDKENILGSKNTVTEEEAKKFGEYACGQTTYGSDLRGSADYRKQIAAVLIKRAALSAGKE